MIQDQWLKRWTDQRMDNRSAMRLLSERWTIPRRGGMFIKIFVSFPTGQHAILSRVHDKRVVVGSHGIEPRDRKVPLGCFTSDHSKARSLSCILPRVSRVLGPGIPFSLSPTSFGQSKHIFEGWNQPTIYTSNSSPLYLFLDFIFAIAPPLSHVELIYTKIFVGLRFRFRDTRYLYMNFWSKIDRVFSFVSRCYLKFIFICSSNALITRHTLYGSTGITRSWKKWQPVRSFRR